MHTKTNNLLQEREDQVVRLFFRLIRSGRSTNGEALRRLAALPAPRFYVSFHKARRFVSLIERGLPLPLKNPNKTRMYRDIHRIWKRDYPHAGYAAVERVLEGPAPSFYISPRMAGEIIYRSHTKRRGGCPCGC